MAGTSPGGTSVLIPMSLPSGGAPKGSSTYEQRMHSDPVNERYKSLESRAGRYVNAESPNLRNIPLYQRLSNQNKNYFTNQESISYQPAQNYRQAA